MDVAVVAGVGDAGGEPRAEAEYALGPAMGRKEGDDMGRPGALEGEAQNREAAAYDSISVPQLMSAPSVERESVPDKVPLM